jgi:hypothetical protein
MLRRDNIYDTPSVGVSSEEAVATAPEFYESLK